MVVLLDTNIVVDHLRSRGDTALRLEVYAEVCLPSVVCGELLFGSLVSGSPVKNREKVLAFIRRSRVLEVDLNVAEQYAQIRQQLQKKGRPIPENDIWIAATACAYNLKLLTRDQHFFNIEGLSLELWT